MEMEMEFQEYLMRRNGVFGRRCFHRLVLSESCYWKRLSDSILEISSENSFPHVSIRRGKSERCCFLPIHTIKSSSSRY